MNFNLILIFLVFNCSVVLGQDFIKQFSRKNFPPNQFKITDKGFFFHNLRIVFKVVKDIRKGNGTEGECHIYLTIYKNEFVIDQSSLADTWLEGDCAIPKVQPLENYFMINYYGEWNGEITLIDTMGKIIKFPGYYWAATKDKQFIFTKAIYPDSDLPVTKFDAETGKYTTKSWHYALQGEPWKDVNPVEYNDASTATSFCPRE